MHSIEMNRERSSGLMLGTHVSMTGGAAACFHRAASLEIDTMQIFTRNQRQWVPPPLSDGQVDEFKALRQRFVPGPVLAHASYLINPATTDPLKIEKSRVALADELQRATRLGIDFLVLHPGSATDGDRDAGLNCAAAMIGGILGEIATDVIILLETTAGQGNTLGWTFAELGAIRKALRPEIRGRTAVCLDTAHVFAAGYDISAERGFDRCFEEFDTAIGMDVLAALHLNDSATDSGSRRDRHAHIGQGKIGLYPFRRLMSDPWFTRLPKILETEKGDDLAEDRMNLAVLRQMAACQ